MTQIDKIKAEIERHIAHYEKIDRNDFNSGELYICQELLSLIESLEKEQPQGLNEAAEKYSQTRNPYGKKAFKAGAEWMAGQGVTKEDTVDYLIVGHGSSAPGVEIIFFDDEFHAGDKVIVQIRKI